MGSGPLVGRLVQTRCGLGENVQNRMTPRLNEHGGAAGGGAKDEFSGVWLSNWRAGACRVRARLAEFEVTEKPGANTERDSEKVQGLDLEASRRQWEEMGSPT